MNGSNRNPVGAERKSSCLLMLLMLAAVMLTVLLLRVQPASAATMKTIAPGQEDKITVKVSKKQYVDSGTVLVIQIPFKAGGLNWTLNIGRDPKNTWISALKK